MLSLQMLPPPSTTRFGALQDAATTSRSLAVSLSASWCSPFLKNRARTPYPQAPDAAGHGALTGVTAQPPWVLPCSLRRRFRNEGPRLGHTGSVCSRSTVAMDSAHTAASARVHRRVAHRANQQLPRGARSAAPFFAEKPLGFQ